MKKWEQITTSGTQKIFADPDFPAMYFIEAQLRQRSHELVDPQPGCGGSDAAQLRAGNS